MAVTTVNNVSVGRKNLTPTSVDDNSVDSPHVKAELTSHQYKVHVQMQKYSCFYMYIVHIYMYGKLNLLSPPPLPPNSTQLPIPTTPSIPYLPTQSYHVVMVHKVRSNTEVLLGKHMHANVQNACKWKRCTECIDIKTLGVGAEGSWSWSTSSQ